MTSRQEDQELTRVATPICETLKLINKRSCYKRIHSKSYDLKVYYELLVLQPTLTLNESVY